MLGSKIEPPKPTKERKLGLTGSASSEFAKRFLTKPTRQPKVIDFSAGNIHGDKKRRGINGFFPPMKLRNSAKDLSPKSNNNIEIKQNTEQADHKLSIDCNTTTAQISNTDIKESIAEEHSDTCTHILLEQRAQSEVELTHRNMARQFPSAINIPIVERSSSHHTDESGSTRRLETTVQFKLPPAYIGEISENVDEMTCTRSKCTACKTPEKATDSPNIWIVQQDFNESKVNYEDFTNAILGHRFRRERTIACDRSPLSKSLVELPLMEETHIGAPVEKSKAVIWNGNKKRERYNVKLMKHMTREMYTNLKLLKSSSRTKDDRLQLVPTSFSEVRPRSEMSRGMSRASRRSVAMRKTPESVRTAPAYSGDTYVSYPDTFDCDDLSYLPPPKRILPRRDVPWVFRFKVKRNMNELSKILASKPQHTIENI